MYKCPNCDKAYPEIEPPQVIEDNFWSSEGWRVSECQNCKCVWKEEYKIVTTNVSIVPRQSKGE